MATEINELIRAYQGNKEFLIYLGLIMIVFEVLTDKEGKKTLSLVRYEKRGLIDPEGSAYWKEKAEGIMKDVELAIQNIN